MRKPNGLGTQDSLVLNFDYKLKLEFHGTKVTSDAVLMAYLKLNKVIGLTSKIDSELRDNRTSKNAHHGSATFFAQTVNIQ